MKTTGFHQAAAIPLGATITRRYFCEPGHGAIARNGEFGTHRDALVMAIEAKKAALDAQPRDGLLSETIVIDVRWVMAFPDGGSQDSLAERFTYDNLADAQAHVGRIDKFVVDVRAAR